MFGHEIPDEKFPIPYSNIMQIPRTFPNKDLTVAICAGFQMNDPLTCSTNAIL